MHEVVPMDTEITKAMRKRIAYSTKKTISNYFNTSQFEFSVSLMHFLLIWFSCFECWRLICSFFFCVRVLSVSILAFRVLVFVFFAFHVGIFY